MFLEGCGIETLKILGISGSLRKDSSNSLLLGLAQNFLSNLTWLNFDISQLPFFDPDNQFSENVPEKAIELRSLANQSDLIFVCTPEYARGAPGVLKNAFEWMFNEGTQRKPLLLVIGSAQGEATRSQLIEVLTTMDFEISLQQTLLIKGARTLISKEGFKDKKVQDQFFFFLEENLKRKFGARANL